ncbi:MAG: DNA/RNA nuclease SfsA [Clostridia bacterium]|nr:DNA/RNA nuclease SfsA [Clostridia bacterium]
MQYGQVIQGRFLSRPNRFIAHVEVRGESLVTHVKNTGRCRELLIPGATVYLEKAQNPARKTPYDLIAVQKGSLLINMDSQAPNKVFAEAAPRLFPGLSCLKAETFFEDSRFDFYLEAGERRAFVEVKGVTLEEAGVCRFPDAPTERGVKHLKGLVRALEAGYEAYVFFVIQMKGVHLFEPNDRTHPAFGDALRQAAQRGVQVRALDCLVTPDTLMADQLIPINLQRRDDL